MNAFLKISILISSLVALPSYGWASPDLNQSLTELVQGLNNQPEMLGTSVDTIQCPEGPDLTNLLVTGLKDRGIPAQSLNERAKELTSNLQAGVESPGLPWLLSGTCLLQSNTQILNLRISDAQSGRILATYATPSTPPSDAAPSEATSLLTQLRKLSDEVIKNLDAMDGNLRYQRFAVANFQELGDSTKDKELGLVVSAQLQSMLQNDHNLFMVEREEIARIVEEIQLGQMGLVSEKDAVEIGKMSGAQALIMGSVSEAGANYIVNVKIVSVNEARVWASAETTLPAADLIALSSEAAVLRTRSGAIYRSTH